MTGFVTPEGNVWGRPVGVTVAKDGSLLFSEDGNKTIWRGELREVWDGTPSCRWRGIEGDAFPVRHEGRAGAEYYTSNSYDKMLRQ